MFVLCAFHSNNMSFWYINTIYLRITENGKAAPIPMLRPDPGQRIFFLVLGSATCLGRWACTGGQVFIAALASRNKIDLQRDFLPSRSSSLVSTPLCGRVGRYVLSS